MSAYGSGASSVRDGEAPLLRDRWVCLRDLGAVLVAVLDEAVPAGWLVVRADEPSRTPPIMHPDVHVSRQLEVIQPDRSRRRCLSEALRLMRLEGLLLRGRLGGK